jgi:hypothetical protein
VKATARGACLLLCERGLAGSATRREGCDIHRDLKKGAGDSSPTACRGGGGGGDGFHAVDHFEGLFHLVLRTVEDHRVGGRVGLGIEGAGGVRDPRRIFQCNENFNKYGRGNRS